MYYYVIKYRNGDIPHGDVEQFLEFSEAEDRYNELEGTVTPPDGVCVIESKIDIYRITRN